MQRPVTRILTTHTGSLPRPPELLKLLQVSERGQAVDRLQLKRQVSDAVDLVVRKQLDIGIDIVNDGEQGKPDYSTYIKHRLTGFDGETERHPTPRDARDFPEFFATQSVSTQRAVRPSCTGPIAWKDLDAVRADVDHLTAATARARVSPEKVFMTAVSPGQAARFLGNRYYPSHEKYIFALADVLKDEYDAIVAGGFSLQLDCPDLASGWNNQFSETTLAQFRDIVRLHIAALNRATRDIPPERIRVHLCWGNYAGPHTHDIPLRDIIDVVLAARAAGITFEGANPRHEHEWRVFREFKLPPGKYIVPGVVDSVSNFVEHPRTVADRIIRFAEAAGRENVMAGADCGFATFADQPSVHPSIAWAKLASLVEGARLASTELWPRS